jgi:preprotein translocase subunit SecG
LKKNGRNKKSFLKREIIVMGLILMLILVVLLIGALPTWNYSRGWGYRPTGFLGVLFLIILILILMNIIHFWDVDVDVDSDSASIQIEQND